MYRTHHCQILVFGLILITGFSGLGCSGSGSEEAPRVINEAAVERIDTTFQAFVDRGDIAGVSALIYEKGNEVYFNALGMADREQEIPMERNSIIQIYSMTKPLTGTALMQLYEQGAFDFDDPVSDYLPEFKDAQVYAGENESGEMILEPPRREMTIRDITRHTAGFIPNSGAPAHLAPLMQEADPMNLNNSLSEMGERLASLPLWFHPGEQWSYGISVDVQALLVERLSGMPFHEYLREHILDPLGMHETRYYVPEEDRDRLATIYHRSEDGTLTPANDERGLNTNQWTLKPGGYGLTSTLDDYIRFAQMLINEGEYNGNRILQPETVRLMATNHLEDNVTERSWLPTKGNVGFGINFAVRTAPPSSPEENPGVVGEFFWDGYASTLFWADPENELTAILFVQLIPFDAVGLQHAFRKAVYEDVVTYPH